MIDLSQPPYSAYVELLDELRASPEARAKVAFHEAEDAERGTHDGHWEDRARVVHLLLLSAGPEDLELIRFLLDEEITSRRRDSFQGAGDPLTILSILTLEYGDISDIGRFWAAKRANFDTWAGGYDMEFVFAHGSSHDVVGLLRERVPAQDLKLLDRYDEEAVAELAEDLPEWRESLERRYPRSLEAMSNDDFEAWADLFDDPAGIEHFGTLNAEDAEDLARLHERLDNHEKAVDHWRQAAREAEKAWDRISRLRNLLSAAAEASITVTVTDVIDEIHHLRSDIPSWPEVGLGRMTTEACYAVAAATKDPESGRHAFGRAQTWRRELKSFPLAGLETAIKAAEAWGEPSDVESLRRAADEERRRIYGPGGV